MVGIGWPELVSTVLLVAAVVIGWRWGSHTQWLPVDDRWRAAVTPVDLEPALTHLLQALPAAELRSTSPGTWTVTVSRAPWWTVFPSILLFPVGLLFLLVRERAPAQVLIAAVEGETEVRLMGTTRASIRSTLAEAMADLSRPPL